MDDLVKDFMKMCLQQKENMRVNADGLLKHEFISSFEKATTDNDFKSYLNGSNIDKLKKEKYKTELSSITQSLSELVAKGKIGKHEMAEHIEQIQNITQ